MGVTGGFISQKKRLGEQLSTLLVTVLGQYKFNLDFGSPPGELSYYLWISSNYVSRYRVCGIFQGCWNLTSRTYSRPMTV